jgi:hypothetical protein
MKAMRDLKVEMSTVLDIVQGLVGRLQEKEKQFRPVKKEGVEHSRRQRRRVLLEQIRRDLDLYRLELVGKDKDDGAQGR